MRFLLTLLLPVVATFAGGPEESSSAVELLAVAPSDALLVVSTDRFAAIRERCGESAWSRFLKDERLSLGGLFQSILEEEGGAAEWAETEEFFASIDGEALGFLTPLKGGGEFAGGILVQPEEGLPAFLKLYDQFVERVRATDHTTVTSREHAGAELNVFEERAGGVTVVFQTRGVVGAGIATESDNAVALAQRMIDRINGVDASPGFAADPSYLAALEAVRGSAKKPVVDAHLKLQELLAAAGASDAPMNALGFDKMRWVHVSADIGPGESLDLEVAVHVPRGTLLGTIADRFEPLPIDLLKRMPADGNAFSLGNLDVAQALQELKTYFSKADPEKLAMLEGALAVGSSELGVDLEALVQSLTGRFASYSTRIPEEELPDFGLLGYGETVPASLQYGEAYFIGVRDLAVAKTGIKAILKKSGMGPLVETEVVDGTPVHTLDTGLFVVHWAVLADGIAVGCYRTPLLALVRQSTASAGTARSAADEPRFADAVKACANSSIVSVSDTATLVQAMLGGVQLVSALALPYANGDGLAGPRTLLTDPPDPAMVHEFFHGTIRAGVRRQGDVLSLFANAR